MDVKACIVTACALLSYAEALPSTGYVSVALPRRSITQHAAWHSELEEIDRDVLKPDEEALHILENSYGNPPLCITTHPNPALSSVLVFTACDMHGANATKLTFDKREQEGGMTVRTEDGRCLGVHETLLQLASLSLHDSIKVAARVELQLCTGHASQRFVFLPSAGRNFATPLEDDVASGSFCLEAHTMFCWNFYQLTAFPDLVHHNAPRGLVVSNHALRFELKVRAERYVHLWDPAAIFWLSFIVGCGSSAASLLVLGTCCRHKIRQAGQDGICKLVCKFRSFCSRSSSQRIHDIIDEQRTRNARTMAAACLLIMIPQCLNATWSMRTGLSPPTHEVQAFSDDSMLVFLLTPVFIFLAFSITSTWLDGKILDGLNMLTYLAVLLCQIFPLPVYLLLKTTHYYAQYRMFLCVLFGNTVLNVCAQLAVTILLVLYRSTIFPIGYSDSNYHPDFMLPKPHLLEFFIVFIICWSVERERKAAAHALVLAHESKLDVKVFKAMMSCYCDITVTLDSQLRMGDGGSKLFMILFQTEHERGGVDFTQLLLPESRQEFVDCVRQLQLGESGNLARLHAEFRSAYDMVMNFRLDVCAWSDSSGNVAFLLGLTEDSLNETAEMEQLPQNSPMPPAALSDSGSKTSGDSTSENDLYYTQQGDILQSSRSFKKYYGLAHLKPAFASAEEFDTFMDWHRNIVLEIVDGERDESKLAALVAPVALLRSARRDSPADSLHEVVFAVNFYDKTIYTGEPEEFWEFSASIISCRRVDRDLRNRTRFQQRHTPAPPQVYGAAEVL